MPKPDYKEAKVLDTGSLDGAICCKNIAEELLPIGDYDTLAVYQKYLFPNNLRAF